MEKEIVEEREKKSPYFHCRGILPPAKPKNFSDEEVEEKLKELEEQKFSAFNRHSGRLGNMTFSMLDEE